MKVAILAGGFGSRLSPETEAKPKPMIEIGGKPILWHIMRYYEHFGFSDFAIALGYQGDYVRKWFVDYAAMAPNLRVNFRSGDVVSYGLEDEKPTWTVDLIETGLRTGTGGRLKRLAPYLGEGTYMMTLGDGVSNVDLRALVSFHLSHGKLATLTAVRPPARFGHLEFKDDRVVEFNEKPQTGEGWINGAFFVLEPEVFDLIDGDETMFEREPLERLAAMGQLMAYRHHDFWQCMDTPRDWKRLEELWNDAPPWKVWA